MKTKILMLLLLVALSGCGAADMTMYDAYVKIYESNNQVEIEKLRQEGETARAAIKPNQKNINQNKVETNTIREKKEKITELKERYLKTILLHNIQNKNNFVKNAFFQKYSDDNLSIMTVSNGPPCSVICADGCTEECIKKCDICDESSNLNNDFVDKEMENELKKELEKELEKNNDENDEKNLLNELLKELEKELENKENALNSDQNKEQEKVVSQQPSIQIIGATGNITLNLGAGAKTSSGQQEQGNKNIALPKSTSQTAVEKGFDLAGDVLKFGTWLGIADVAGDAIESVSNVPRVNNEGRTEIFDSRDQSVTTTTTTAPIE